MPRPKRLALFLLACFCAGCATALPPPPTPVAVGHLDMTQKEAYIARTGTTLQTFHSAAADLRSRSLSAPLQELGENFDRYVAMQVAPIVEDAEARSNLATRMELAGLQLLCGLVYIELGDHHRIEAILAQMEDYGTDTGILNSPLAGDIGITRIEDGLKRLRESLDGAPSPAPAEQASAPGKDSAWIRIFSTPSPKGSSAP